MDDYFQFNDKSSIVCVKDRKFRIRIKFFYEYFKLSDFDPHFYLKKFTSIMMQCNAEIDLQKYALNFIIFISEKKCQKFSR